MTSQALQISSSAEIQAIRKITENSALSVERRAIVASSCPKISDDTSEREILQFILYAMALVGFPPARYPGELEKVVLANVIRSQMRHYSLEELRLAFDFAVTRKFEVDLRFFADSVFSSEYIGRVVSAYDKYTAELIAAEYRRQKDEQTMKDLTFKEQSPSEKYETGRLQFDFVLQTFRLQNSPPLFADWTLILRYLEADKLIIDSQKFKKIFFEKVKRDLKAEATSEAMNRKPGDIRLIDELRKIDRGEIKTECRKRRVIRYIRKLLKKELLTQPNETH